jgi:glyoxylase-like metal-dependent hydrolase (beta-lactamase superfamily II)/rhodanese-related sulfurtransferase
MGFQQENLIPLVDEGLGNSAYLVDLGDGRALAIDVSLDLRPVRAAASRRGLRIAYAADTHLHADFLSGAVQLARDDDATVIASAAGGRTFPHVGLADEQDLDLNGLTLRGLATPGHTDEHTAFALLDGANLLGVFTGGSLLVGSAARTDLLGTERADELASAQYRSLQRLAALPDPTPIWPTHGAGSFCSAPPSAERTSTVGAQKRTNPLLRTAGEAQFVRDLLASLGSYPAYFARLGEINRLGPAPLPAEDDLPGLDPGRVAALRADGAWIVDARPARDFAAGHIPGAVSIPLRDQFATWLGWVVPDDVPLVVVLAADQDPAEVFWQAHKIGYTRLIGCLAGGLAAWTGSGRTVETTAFLTADRLEDRPVVDVRQHSEHQARHIPHAINLELGTLSERADQAEPGAVVSCGHGERGMTAASLLQRLGRRDVAVLDGGPDDWAQATGQPLAGPDTATAEPITAP